MSRHPLLYVGLVLAVAFIVAGLLPNRLAPQYTVAPPASVIDAQLDCSDRKDADLCTQRRIATAAEAQYAVGAVGLALLFGTLLFTGWAAISAKQAAIAAAQSVSISQQTLTATQRPWVSCTPRIGSALVFKDGAATIKIDFLLRNFGVTPATNVEVHHRIVTEAHEAWAVAREVVETTRKRKPNRALGHKIFPTDTFIFGITTTIPKNDIDAFGKRFGQEESDKLWPPTIVGCVVYNSPFNSTNHVTEFMVQFGKRDHENPKIFLAFDIAAGQYPIDDIDLRLGFGTGLAD